MNEKRKLRFELYKMLCKFEKIETDNGVLVVDDTLKAGVEIFDEDGNPVKDGDYNTGETIITVKDGKVEAIKDVEAPEEKVEVEVEEPADEKLEEEVVVTEEPAEEDPKVAELEAKIAELEEVIKAKDAEIEDLNNKIKELEDKPSEESVVVAPEELSKVKSGDSRIDRWFEK